MQLRIASPLAALLAVFTASVFGQGTKADYERMSALGRRTTNKVFRTNVEPNWLSEREAFWYKVETGPQASEFIFVDLSTGNRSPAFDHQRIAEQLHEFVGAKPSAKISPDQLPLRDVVFSNDGASVFARVGDRFIKIDRGENTVTEVEQSDLPKLPSQLETPRPSTNKGGEVYVTVVNNSPGPLSLVWINRSGRPERYATIPKGESRRQHTFVGHVWVVQNEASEPVALFEAVRAEQKVEVDGKTKLSFPRSRRRGRRGGRTGNSMSPDGRYRAVIRDDTLWIIEQEGDSEQKVGELTKKGNEFDNAFYWSPNSKYLVALEVTPGDRREIHMIESAPKDQVQPKLHTMRYAKPGDRVTQRRPRLFAVDGFKETPVSDALLQNQWRLDDFRWRDDSKEFFFRFNQRGHQVIRILAVRPEDGEVRAVIEEKTDTFIDYTNKVFSRFDEQANEIIWMSERDGWNHLYLYDWESGKVKNQITNGEWVVREVERVDAEKRQIWFQASGLETGEDPYFLHTCRVNFDGTGFVRLTAGDGTHRIRYSPNRRYFIDRYSRVDQPTITNVRNAEDGALVCELERGDWTQLLKTGWKPTIPFSAKGRDEKTDIFGVIYLPTNFDESQKYPVIEYIYAGPHDSFAPKRFSVHSQARSMAELGFIVVQLDGMGTSNRSKAFHDVCWKNLGDSGFPDRILWIQAAAKKIPQMDLSRIGIYGGSAGGQSALRAMLAHGDFYKAAVADCGCHDNRMDKIWWNEQWMGWPIEAHYREQSNVTNAHKLQGDLLLIVGELDRNVDPASTMQVVDALIKADKDFEMLVVPGAGHGVGSGRYGMRRTRDFFVRRLHGVEPRR